MNDLDQRVRSSFETQGMMKTLGARLLRVAEGEVEIEMPSSPAFSQQRGYAHAGSITSVVDTACGYAALTRAPTSAHDVVTAEFKVNFVRPAIGARFVAVGKVAQAGRTMAVATGEVRAYAGAGEGYKVVALMQATLVYFLADASGG